MARSLFTTEAPETYTTPSPKRKTAPHHAEPERLTPVVTVREAPSRLKRLSQLSAVIVLLGLGTLGAVSFRLPVGKALSRESVTAALVAGNLRLGLRSQAAALVQTLPQGEARSLDYTDLPAQVVEAQLAAGEFGPALTVAKGAPHLINGVLQRQRAVHGLPATLASLAQLPSTVAVDTAINSSLVGLSMESKTTQAELNQLAQAARTGETRDALYQSLLERQLFQKDYASALETAHRTTTDKGRVQALRLLTSQTTTHPALTAARAELASLTTPHAYLAQVSLALRERNVAKAEAIRAKLKDIPSAEQPSPFDLATLELGAYWENKDLSRSLALYLEVGDPNLKLSPLSRLAQSAALKHNDQILRKATDALHALQIIRGHP